MARNLNFFDIALTILFPEAKVVLTELKAVKGITRAGLRAFTRDLGNIRKQLPQLKGTDKQIKDAKTALAKALGSNETDAFRKLLSEPQRLSENLGKMTSQERKDLGETIADATGGIEESSLHSSWLISGIYEETGFGVGTLTLTTKQGKSYDYPNVASMVWEQMKSAKGSNGSGAGSVFWVLYLRKYNRTRTRARTSIAFRLAT